MPLITGQRSRRSIILFISAGIFVIALGVVAITGWLLNIEVLKSIVPGFATLKFNTALCFILSGTSFILLVKHDSLFLKSLFRLIAVCLGVFAALSFSQDIFHWSAGIDQLFVIDRGSIALKRPFPGRMSPSTAISFVFIAISFLGIDSRSLSFRKMAQYMLHFVTLITFIATIGYLFKVPYTLKFSFFSSMAIHTAFGFLLLSIAASSINYNLGITSLFTGTEIGNIIARRLFPRMIIILVAAGYISIELQRYGYISTEFGVILSTISFLLISLFLIRNTLTLMNRLDLKRTEAENETRLINRDLEDRILKRTIALKHSNDRFLKIFNANPICIAMTNLYTGKYTDVNPALLELLGYEREEIIGYTAAELSIISDEYRAGMVNSIATKGFIANEDLVVKDKFNNDKYCILSAELFEDGDEKSMMSFVYDITDRKKTENHLKETKDKLEILTDQLTNQNKQLVSFAHIISHNLRAPVSNLNLLAHFYKESTTQEDKDELWGNFDTVIGHLNTTLDDLLETLKIREDTSKERANLSFEKTFIAVKEILIGQIIESKATIKTDFSRAPHIFYPKIYLESIMLNLISNGIKYKSPKRVPEITIITDEINGETILTIQDNGLGIDMVRHAKSLFGLRKTFHRHTEAKGLGLFITKTQVDAMGGEISAESVVDEGTKFKIIFNRIL